MKIKLKRLRLRKGDILLVKRSPNSYHQLEDLMWAAKQIGIEVNVPIVLVDKLNDYKVRHADLQENPADAGLGSAPTE